MWLPSFSGVAPTHLRCGTRPLDHRTCHPSAGGNRSFANPARAALWQTGMGPYSEREPTACQSRTPASRFQILCSALRAQLGAGSVLASRTNISAPLDFGGAIHFVLWVTLLPIRPELFLRWEKLPAQKKTRHPTRRLLWPEQATPGDPWVFPLCALRHWPPRCLVGCSLPSRRETVPVARRNL